MNKKHSDLEMFMRKFMDKLGLGYQCHYKNRANNGRRQGTNGHWSIEIWDQRPGHYYKRTIKKDGVWNWKDCSGAWPANDPSQKYHTNQFTDESITLIGPEYHGNGYEHKDEFLNWLLFENDFFEILCRASSENYFKNDFMSREAVELIQTIHGNNISEILKEFDKRKGEYQRENLVYKQ